MRALTFQGVKEVACTEAPDPTIEQPTDAIVRVELSAICGSDLHVYRGAEVGLDRGTVLGHEFAGEVLEVGSAVEGIAPGDRVVAPFSTSCGACPACERGLSSRCEVGQLFGWVEGGQGLHGGQAELVRVPLAGSSLVKIADGRDPAALFAGDVMSTGMYLAALGGVGPGDRVAVIGCGPVGLMAVVAALDMGAAEVFALDLLEDRLELARSFGATPILASDPSQLPAAVDASLEAVGSPSSTRLAFDLLRPGGTLAAAGVHVEPQLAFSPGEAYDKNLTYRAGRSPARSLLEPALELAARSGVDRIVSHRIPLAEAAHGYRIFDGRLEGATKVLLEP